MIAMKKKASYRELAIIAGNIGKLYDEGISLLNILNLIDELPLKKEYKMMLKEMEEVIKEGGSLSEGFKRGGTLIPSFFNSMVDIGEKTGKIVYVLRGLETFYSKLYYVKKSIIGALTYPMILLGALALLGVFVVFFFIPNMSNIYSSMGKDIPLAYSNIITFKERLFNKNPNISYTGELKTLNSILHFKCSADNEEWDDVARNVLISGCKVCNGSKRNTFTYKKQLEELNSFVLPLVEYEGSTKKIMHKCHKCGYEFKGNI